MVLCVVWCDVVLCLSVPLVTSPLSRRRSYSPYKENQDQSSGERLGGALLNVIIIIGIIVAMTILLVILYKYRCYRVST
jgi:presenilin 1